VTSVAGLAVGQTIYIDGGRTKRAASSRSSERPVSGPASDGGPPLPRAAGRSHPYNIKIDTLAACRISGRRTSLGLTHRSTMRSRSTAGLR
jgi:hypothetical protein